MGHVLRVLITNRSLTERGGTETYIRDLAEGLLRRGHAPVVYSPRLGDAAADLRASAVPVIDDLDRMGVAPDIIHGQHHLETMTALLRFPGVPAVFVCHGWLPWQEAPPRFPRILRYVAMNEACRDRLLLEHGIPERDIRVTLNAIDLDRFAPRAPLPKRPARALILGNNASERSLAGAVREACRRRGVEMRVVGSRAGTATAHPEAELRTADVVFAMGRSAIEAMAVGAAVIVCGIDGCGPMISMRNVERLRPLNFGIRALEEPVGPDVIDRRLGEYDAADAARVSGWIRERAGRDLAVDTLVALYEEVLAEFGGMKQAGIAGEMRAASEYLRFLSAPLEGHVRREIELSRRRSKVRGWSRVRALLRREPSARPSEPASVVPPVRGLDAALSRPEPHRD